MGRKLDAFLFIFFFNPCKFIPVPRVQGAATYTFRRTCDAWRHLTGEGAIVAGNEGLNFLTMFGKLETTLRNAAYGLNVFVVVVVAGVGGRTVKCFAVPRGRLTRVIQGCLAIAQLATCCEGRRARAHQSSPRSGARGSL